MTITAIVITVGRAGCLECFREGRSDTAGRFVGTGGIAGTGRVGIVDEDAGRFVGTGGIAGTGRVGIVDEDAGDMNVDGTDGSVVLVLFPDCEIVMVVGGIPAAVVVFVLL